VKPTVGYRQPLAYSSPEAVQTTGTVAIHGEVLSLNAPPGTLTTEASAAYKAPSAPAAAASTAPAATARDWPSYNRTLTSERVSDLSQINTQNVSKLKVLCDLVGSALIDNFLVLTTSNI
jgi:glucose dehydrogenase